MRNEEIRSLLGANTVRKNKNGNYIVRWGYFYKAGRSLEKYKELMHEKFPDCIIIGGGDHWASFRGGQSISQGSHFWVEFTI